MRFVYMENEKIKEKIILKTNIHIFNSTNFNFFFNCCIRLKKNDMKRIAIFNFYKVQKNRFPLAIYAHALNNSHLIFNIMQINKNVFKNAPTYLIIKYISKFFSVFSII